MGVAILAAPTFTVPLISKVTALGVGADLHLVGGTVRDFLLGFESCDLDLATILRPEAVVEKLHQNNIRVIETGITHGTVTALIETTPIEITTFRKPSSRAQSQYSQTIEEDLHGRDFTINAIAKCARRITEFTIFCRIILYIINISW